MVVTRSFPDVGIDYPEYVITINSTIIFLPYEFDEIQITEKMNQIPGLECILYSIKKIEGVAITAEYLEDAKIRAYLVTEGVGVQKFSGVITSAKQVPRKFQIKVVALGNAYLAQKRTLPKQTEDYVEKMYSGSSLPAVPGALSSSIIKEALELDQAFDYPEYDIDSEPDYRILYRVESGNGLAHLAEICVENFWTWWIEETDDETGALTVHCKQYRGELKPSVVYEADVHLIEDELAHDKEKLKNIVQVTGASSTASNMSSRLSGTFPLATEDVPIIMGHVVANESKLAESAPKGSTSIKLRDATDYLKTIASGATESTGIVKIGTELLSWSKKDETNPNILILVNPSTEDHSPDDDVLMVNLLKAYIPAEMADTTEFRIGNEFVIGTVTPWGIETMTRSVTTGYCHRNGTKIFPSAVCTGSSLDSYGRFDTRISAIGATDHDGLDKYAQSILLALQDQIDYGYFDVALDDLRYGFDIGDWFYLTPYGETTQMKVQCTGFVYKNETASIYFGCNDDAVLSQFEDLQTIDDLSYCKDDKLREVSVLSVSADKKAVYIKDSANRSRWVRLR